ncbi:POC1 centriolar protein-like protein [Diplonema papillatum]|nr:POC1 centriolar protein-like protein [Diplonema papillatum]
MTAPSSSEVAPGKPPSDSIAAAAVGKASPQGSQVKLATGTSRGAVATKLLAPPDDPAERTRTPPFQTEPDPCLLVRERVAESSQRESQVKLTTGSSRGAVAPTLLSPPDDPAEGTRTPSFQTEPDPCLLAPRESQVKKTSSTSRATAAPGAMAVPGSAETAPESQGTISTGGSHAGTSGSLPFRGLFLARFRAFCRRRGLPHSSSVVKLLFLAEVWPENGHRAALKDMVLEGGSLVAVAERMETKFSDSVRPAGTEARDASAPCRSPGAPSSSCGCDGCRELAPTAVKSATAPAGDGSAIREGRPGDALAETERERARHPGEPAREREHRAQPGTLNGEDEIGKSRAAASGGEGREENSRGDRPVAGARERGQCDRTRGAGAAPRKEEAQSVVPGAGKREATDDGRRSGEPDGGADGAIRPAQAERCRRAAEGPEDTAREAALVFAVETAVIHCEQLALLGCRQAGKDPPASPSSSSAAASASASASASARGRAPPSDSDPTAGALALLASIAEVLLKAAGPALWPRVPALARPLLSVLRRAPPPPPSWGAAWAASSFAAEFHHRAATLAAFACVRALRQAPAPAFKREPVAAAAQPDLGPCLALLTRYLLDAAAGRRHSPLTGGNPYLVTGEDMLAWVASQLLDPSCPQLERTFRGHRGCVRGVRFSPTMQQLVSGSDDMSVMVWNFKPSMRAFRYIGHKAAVNTVCFSPTGELVASGSADKTVKLWIPTVQGEASTIKGHSGAVRCVDFSPDGRKLISASDDKTVKTWSVATQRFVSTLAGHTSWVRTCALSPDGRMAASGGDDKTVKLWDVERRSCLATFYDHQATVSTVAFHPDGTCLAAGSHDTTIKLWDLRMNKELLQHYKAHDDQVNALSFHSSGNWMMSSSSDATVKVWDVQEGYLAYVVTGHTGGVTAAAFSPNGQFFSTGGNDHMVMCWRSNFDAPDTQALPQDTKVRKNRAPSLTRNPAPAVSRSPSVHSAAEAPSHKKTRAPAERHGAGTAPGTPLHDATNDAPHQPRADRKKECPLPAAAGFQPPAIPLSLDPSETADKLESVFRQLDILTNTLQRFQERLTGQEDRSQACLETLRGTLQVQTDLQSQVKHLAGAIEQSNASSAAIFQQLSDQVSSLKDAQAEQQKLLRHCLAASQAGGGPEEEQPAEPRKSDEKRSRSSDDAASVLGGILNDGGDRQKEPADPLRALFEKLQQEEKQLSHAVAEAQPQQ